MQWFWLVVVLFSLIMNGPVEAIGAVFSQQARITPTFGDIWCVPVYDGNNLVVSSESGSVQAIKYDLSLNEIGSAVTVADTADTDGEAIADHKHIFQNGFHYLAFSISGSDSSGGSLYLVKFDTDLHREKIVTVVENDSPTNDMFLVGDGTNVHVGKFNPSGGGHLVYSLDADLNTLGTAVAIGGIGDSHGNGAAAVYDGSTFHLTAPRTIVLPDNDEIYHIGFDSIWAVTDSRESLLQSATNDLGFPSGLLHDGDTGYFVMLYTQADSNDGGPVRAAVYNADWTLLADEELLDGTWHRPHGVLVNNVLYVGYDDGPTEIGLASFAMNLSGLENEATTSVPVSNGWWLGLCLALGMLLLGRRRLPHRR